MKILVAEDNVVNARLLTAVLEREGHEVSVAADGKKAVELARVEAYDLILMDVNMPEMDGLEATRHIRQGAAPMRDVTILALTADDDAKTQKACIEAGMNAFVTKPLDITALKKVLKQSQSRRRAG